MGGFSSILEAADLAKQVHVTDYGNDEAYLLASELKKPQKKAKTNSGSNPLNSSISKELRALATDYPDSFESAAKS